jgi:uncharacterized protein (TIGR03437 family)
LKLAILPIIAFSFVPLGWSQASAVASVVDGLAQPRVAPGGGASIYGSFPTGSRSDFAVTFGGVSAYITFVANDGKINRCFEIDVQVPTEISAGAANVVVSYRGAAIAPFPVTVVPLDPVMALDPFFTFLHTSGVSATPTAPAAPGETITTFMTGLGATNPTVPTGAGVTDFTPTANPVTVTVGGQPSPQVKFAGRYPINGISPSLDYQVSFVVPSGLPNGPAPVIVSIGGVNSNTQTLFIGTSALPNPPVVTAAVNGASFSSTTLIVPGSFVSVFGSGFGTQDNLSAFPSTQVNGISVLFNGQPAPIFHLIASAGQINVLAPAQLLTQETVHPIAIVVQNQNGPSKAKFQSAGAAGPGIFAVPDPSNASHHIAAALLANTAWYILPASLAQTLGLPSCAGRSVASACGQPAKRGDFVQLYTTGLGLATPNSDPNGTPLGTGQVAPANGVPLYTTVAVPIVNVGGQPVTVVFSGIAPGFAGLYQVNFQIPQSVTPGEYVPVTIAMPGSVMDTATLAIQ